MITNANLNTKPVTTDTAQVEIEWLQARIFGLTADRDRSRELLHEFVADDDAGYITHEDDVRTCQYCDTEEVHRVGDTTLYPHADDCLISRTLGHLYGAVA